MRCRDCGENLLVEFGQRSATPLPPLPAMCLRAKAAERERADHGNKGFLRLVSPMCIFAILEHARPAMEFTPQVDWASSSAR